MDHIIVIEKVLSGVTTDQNHHLSSHSQTQMSQHNYAHNPSLVSGKLTG